MPFLQVTLLSFLCFFTLSSASYEERDKKPESFHITVLRLEKQTPLLPPRTPVACPSIKERKEAFEAFHQTGKMPHSSNLQEQPFFCSLMPRSSFAEKVYTPEEREALTHQVLFHPDTAEKIAKYLGQKDLGILRATCRSGYQTYNNPLTLVLHLSFPSPDRPVQTRGEDKFLTSFLGHSKKIETLTIINPSFFKVMKCLEEAGVSLKKLKSLSLRNTHTHNVNLLGLGQMSALTYLNAENPESYKSEENQYPNKVRSCSFLRLTPHLQTLNLAGNQVSSLDGIEESPSLRVLNLDRNPLPSDALTRLSQARALQQFSFVRNDTEENPPLETTDFLVGLNLTSLNLEGHNVSNATLLANHSNLRHLNLGNNHLNNIAFLENLVHLETLYLETNTHTIILDEGELEESITDLTPLTRLTDLRKLNLRDNRVMDISPLSTLHELSDLNVARNRLVSIQSLGALKSLQTLNIEGNILLEGNISALSSLENLQNINISHTGVQDLLPLQHLKNLRWIYASHNKIRSLSPLILKKNLITLHISDNPIDSLEPLSALPSLITLEANKIGNVSLIPLPKSLVFLSLDSNGIRDSDPFPESLTLFTLSLKGNMFSVHGQQKLRDTRISKEIYF